MNTIFTYLIPITVAVVFLILCVGIYTLFRGGDVGRSWSNRMMRLRVAAQFVAIIVLCAAVYFKDHFVK